MTSKWHNFMGCDKQFRGRMNQPQQGSKVQNWKQLIEHEKASKAITGKKKVFCWESNFTSRVH